MKSNLLFVLSRHIAIMLFLPLSACVTPSNQYSNTPQAACQSLGISQNSPSWNDCLIKMAASDRDATNNDKLVRCTQARQNAANNTGGGFGAGFLNAQNVNMACQ